MTCQVARAHAPDGEAYGAITAKALADPDSPPMPSGDALDGFRRKWLGSDPYEAVGRFQDKWRAEGCAVIRSPDGAFLKFAEGMFKARAGKGRAAA